MILIGLKTMQVKIIPETEKFSSDAHSSNILVSIKAPDREKTRKPINLITVIDVSKSMSDGKLDLIKSSLQFVTDHMTAEDTLALVRFSCKAKTVIPLTKMDIDGKSRLSSAIHRLRANGATNLSAGLFEALSLLPAKSQTSDFTVILFTDGAANMGLIDSEDIKKGLLAYQSPTVNVNMVYMGYGEDHDVKMLKSLVEADYLNSTYYYIEDKESISSCFAECLGGLLSLCYQNVKILCQCETMDMDKSYDLGDLLCEQEKNILIKIKLHEGEDPIEIKCFLEYYNIRKEKYVKEEETLLIERTDISKIELPNSEVLKHINRTYAVECMYKALNEALEDVSKAQRSLENCIQHIQSTAPEDDSLAPILIEDLKQCLNDLRNSDRQGMGRLFHLSISHSLQRSSCYTNSLQESLIKKVTE
jgi:Mg-chelatase subunit ChlD